MSVAKRLPTTRECFEYDYCPLFSAVTTIRQNARSGNIRGFIEPRGRSCALPGEVNTFLGFFIAGYDYGTRPYIPTRDEKVENRGVKNR
jgi:hypothetical protein